MMINVIDNSKGNKIFFMTLSFKVNGQLPPEPAIKLLIVEKEKPVFSTEREKNSTDVQEVFTFQQKAGSLQRNKFI